ncbi:porin family protein [Hymenobacter sp. GOD-10R]|uniref:porin family protein n=1 Tax=Hymenobacter sp. GOD-10R TaxID=3093922 RepID=UPI002D79D498|nr:porin family protein [Hymenobacter sp. GOD-10R]WRQ28234.1 porin family protein [Hymenobacter sp. GOD-10R]
MKQLAVLFVGLFAASTAHAQLGVRVGANTGSVSAKTDEFQEVNTHNRTGYQLGAFYEKKLTERWSVVPEVQFSNQRMNMHVVESGIADGGYEASYRLRLRYLNVPIVARATFGRFYLEAGPQVGFLINTKEKGTATYGSFLGSYSTTFNRYATDNYHRVDLGLVAGVGVKLPAGFGLGMRGYTGLLSIAKDENTQYSNFTGTLKNQVAQVSLTYQLASR